MDLTDEDITEFANIWEKEFGERLSIGQACIEANNLMELAWLVVQPFPGELGDGKTVCAPAGMQTRSVSRL